MKICYVDAFSGIAGDMLVGALLDAGAGAEALFSLLERLGTGARFRVEKTRRRGIAASKFFVSGGEAKSHRHLPQILRMIEAAGLPERAQVRARAVFERLAAAEARVHGVPVEKVHFHEVGAVDSIADIVGACAALELLGIEKVYCSAVNVGSGTVNTEHGVLPVPAPATAALLEGKPVYARGPAMELTTPTGAALAVTLAAEFGPLPPMKIQTSGFGAGDRDFAENANVLRVLVGEPTGATEAATVVVLEANIDDSTPEMLAYAVERLMVAGALDASLTPLIMKKGRPGVLLRALATEADREEIAGLMLRETSTLGLRMYRAERRVLARRMEVVSTPLGSIRMKISESGAAAPEFEDCRKLAEQTGKPLPEIYRLAVESWLAQHKQ